MNGTYRLGRWALACALFFAGLGCEEEVVVTRVPGTLEVPPTIDFGDVPLGVEVNRRIRIRNSGGSSVTIESLELVGQVNALSLAVQDPPSLEIPGGGVSVNARVDLIALRAEDEPSEVRLRIRARTIDQTLEAEVRIRGRGVDSSLFVRPNPLSFGRVRVGTTRQREVEVINLQTEPVELWAPFEGTSVDFERGGAFFQVVERPDPDRNGSLLPEGTLLQPGEAVRLTVEYRPDVTSIEQANQGQFLLRSCGTTQCEALVQVNGIGVRQGLVCDPGSVDFGAVRPGRSETRFIRCTNENNVDLEVTDWRLDPEQDDSFRVDPFQQGPLLLEPGQVFEVAVQFDARSDRLGDLQLGELLVFGTGEDDREPIRLAEIELQGVAGGPVAQVEPESVNFGTVRVGQLARSSVTLTNAGFSDLSIQELAVDGPVAFGAEDPPLNLSRGLSREVGLTFEPDTAGGYMGAFVLLSSDPIQPELTIPAQGLALDTQPCRFEPVPSRVEFGAVPVGASVRDALVLRNTGTDACIFREFAVEGSDAAAYRLINPPSPSVVVPAGGSAPVTLEFSPSEAGDFPARVTFAASDDDPAREEVTVTGFGGSGELLVAPTTLDFGTVELGCGTEPQRVQITNLSISTEEISRFELVPLVGDPDAFRLRDLPPGLPPLPGGTRPINIRQTLGFLVDYRAQELGDALARIDIDVANRPISYSVRLRARGAENAVRVERFEQNEVARIDILFVLDNSFSMRDRIDFLREQVADIFDVIDASGVDYQVGLITTDTEGFVNGQIVGPCGFPSATPPGNWVKGSCGYLSDGNTTDSRPEWRIVQPNEVPSPGDAFRELLEVPFPGNPVERGLAAMATALTPPVSQGWNAGFVRPDADLAVVVLADDDDFSQANVDFYVGLLKGLKAGSGRRASINAVVPADNINCNVNEGELNCITETNRYFDAAALTDGVVLSSGLTPDSTPEELAEEYAQRIISLLDRAISPRTSFRLAGTPAPGSVEVVVGGVPLPESSPAGGQNWSFDENANRIEFTERSRPGPGQAFEVRYRTLCF